MIYTMGYSGKTIDQIKNIAEELDATIFDIRYSPRSRNPQFSGKRLAEALGDRYMHIRAFGNKNYKGGPIEILDFQSGLNMIAHHNRRNIILMCVCKDHNICHRTTVANKLKEFGYTVKELNEKKQQPKFIQLTLVI